MVTQNGVFSRKTAQEREMERRVKERKEQLLEYYRTQQRGIVPPAPAPLASVGRGGGGGGRVASSALDGTEGRMESMAAVSQVSPSLHSVDTRSYLEEKKVASSSSSEQGDGERRSPQQFAPDREEIKSVALLQG